MKNTIKSSLLGRVVVIRIGERYHRATIESVYLVDGLPCYTVRPFYVTDETGDSEKMDTSPEALAVNKDVRGKLFESDGSGVYPFRVI